MRYRALFLSMTIAAMGCGGGSSGSGTPTAPTPPTPNPGGGTSTTTITITAAGVSPRSLTVAPGTRVTFVNNDTRAHEMNSDPHPTHGDCPGIDQVGSISPGQSKLTGNLNDIRTCGFHDHNLPGLTALQGTIIVRNP